MEFIPPQIASANDVFSATVSGEKKIDIPDVVKVRSGMRSLALQFSIANSSKMGF